MKKIRKGFTLAEMLIVVAIIGILVAVLVPSFTSLLTKANTAKDQANLRSAYEEGVAVMLSGEKTVTKDVFKAKVILSDKYKKVQIFGNLHFADKSPTFMPEGNVVYENGVPYLKASSMTGKKYIIVRVLPDGSVGYEALAQDSHHPDSYYDKIYGSYK